MADFAAAFLAGTVGDAAELEDILEGDLTVRRKHQQATAATDSTTSSSFSTIATESAVACLADEVHLVIGSASFSGNNAGDLVEFAIFADSTELVRRPHAINSQTSTGGNRQSVALIFPAHDLSGSIDFTMQFRRVSGSGTLYVSRKDLTVLTFKKRT